MWKVIKRRKLSSDREDNVEQSLELNKLEAHLLKLTIPFVRIAHCPRGTYFKVRGNLILISADISHSLSRILPQGQKIFFLFALNENLNTVVTTWKK